MSFYNSKNGVRFIKKLRLRSLFIIVLASIMIGIVTGAADTIFGRILLEISDFRDNNIIYLLPFLPIAGILIVGTYRKIGKEAYKGMDLVFDAGHYDGVRLPKRMLPLAIAGTWLTHLFGGSAGREGVAVQIGSVIGNFISNFAEEDKSRFFGIAGMAAGFSGLFQTPIAAVFFALEVLTVGKMEYRALVPAVIASFTASATSNLLGLEKFSWKIVSNIYEYNDIKLLSKMAILGLVFGLAGLLFATMLKKAKSMMSDYIKEPGRRILILGVTIAVLLALIHLGRYSGLGTNLISESLSGGEIYKYDWILKILFTVLTLSAGFQGGEVTPLFAIGASLGAIIAGVFGLPVPLVAALGYATVFGAATNTFFAPIFIGGEVFGFNNIPLFF